ncbi:DNA cytosine methyltransferase [Amedibacillus sp. YH-ame6]
MKPKSNTKPIQLLELFGGIGAPRRGMEKANFNIKSQDYVEILPYAVFAYNKIFNNDYIPQDIINWNMNIDILVHGSPCQDFSKNGLNNINTGRSILYERTLEIIDIELFYKPPVAVWENVPNLLSKRHREHFVHYIESMERMGYTNSYQIVDASKFGIAQKRERLIVVSTLNGIPFVFPKGNEQRISIKEFIDYDTNFDDYKLSENEKSLFFEMDGNLFVKEATKLGYKLVEEFDVVNVERPNSKTRRGRVGKQIANTLTTNPKQVIYYDGKLRYLTAKEHVRLTGFEDDDYYKLKNSGLNDKQISSLMGNSIVVNMLMEIFKELYRQGFIGNGQ